MKLITDNKKTAHKLTKNGRGLKKSTKKPANKTPQDIVLQTKIKYRLYFQY
jgi:hypothetical protein